MEPSEDELNQVAGGDLIPLYPEDIKPIYFPFDQLPDIE